MKNFGLWLAGFSVFCGYAFPSQATQMPTWVLRCTSSPQALSSPELLLMIDRVSPGSVAKATLSHEALPTQISDSFASLSLVGGIEEGHDHLVINLTPTGLSADRIGRMTVDLSYGSSLSTLYLNDGRQFQYVCASALN